MRIAALLVMLLGSSCPSGNPSCSVNNGGCGDRAVCLPGPLEPNTADGCRCATGHVLSVGRGPTERPLPCLPIFSVLSVNGVNVTEPAQPSPGLDATVDVPETELLTVAAQTQASGVEVRIASALTMRREVPAERPVTRVEVELVDENGVTLRRASLRVRVAPRFAPMVKLPTRWPAVAISARGDVVVGGATSFPGFDWGSRSEASCAGLTGVATLLSPLPDGGAQRLAESRGPGCIGWDVSLSGEGDVLGIATLGVPPLRVVERSDAGSYAEAPVAALSGAGLATAVAGDGQLVWVALTDGGVTALRRTPAGWAPEVTLEVLGQTLAVSHDSSRVAVGLPGSLRVYARGDGGSWSTVQELPGPSGLTRIVALSSDGRVLVASSSQGTRMGATLWALEDGVYVEKLRMVDSRDQHITLWAPVAVSADGRLAAVSFVGEGVMVAERRDGGWSATELVALPDDGTVHVQSHSIGLSGDGRRLVVGIDPGAARVFEAR